MIRQARAEGKVTPGNLATLEDRILIRQGKKQVYGTQLKTDTSGINTLFPIEDEANVDKRRASMGMIPLKEYLKRFGIAYSPQGE